MAGASWETKEDRIVRARTHHYSLRDKRENARLRDEIAHAQSPQERIYILDQRLGINVGAKRERNRLWRKINDGVRLVT